ncbi:MAG: tRNA (adenosine(37)-N6)-dimethylallyltransferase MiaA [Dehalococcoidia bacterium]|nr:tRNA (adenosine(37)-N6)-dimethylallyltransferase MiaA [Dehalococcoidia bacterium]
MTRRRLIAIVGPTATGKTALAVELAHRLKGEVVGADSRQVYRHMDVGTAKPTAEERAAAPHHLIDVVDPDEPFSLGLWLELAQAALEDVWSRGRQPLLAGGTGQYVWALLEGWRVPRVAPNPEFRCRMEARDAVELFESVRRVDPAAAARIGPANRRRLVRALEVYEATGRPISYWQTKEPPGFETTVIGLHLPREELYRRIDERVDRMMTSGLIDETRRLLAMGYSRELPSMSGIGYKEACAHLAGDPSTSSGQGLTLTEAAARTKTETHRLARHQNSWFKPSDPRIHWLDGGESAIEEALRLIESELSPERAAARGR